MKRRRLSRRGTIVKIEEAEDGRERREEKRI